MTTVLQTSLWTLAVDGIAHAFEVLAGRVVLDERNLMYGEATIEVAPIPDSVLNDLDPTQLNVRATITTARDVTVPSSLTQARDHEMVLLSRSRNPDQTVTLRLATDEAVLAARANVDAAAVAMGSVTATSRDVIDSALDNFADGASLAAGSVDADLYRLLSLRNVVGSGSFETVAAIAGWAAVANASTLARSNAVAARIGTYSLRWVATAATTAVTHIAKWSLTKGKISRLLYSMRPTTTSVTITVHCFNAAGSPIATYNVAQVATAGAWNDYLEDFEPGVGSVPADAVSIDVVFVVLTAAVSSAQYLDAVSFYELPAELRDKANRGTAPGTIWPYFEQGFWNGDTAGSASYAYAWDGTAHAPASSSTRTALVDREYRLTILDPGQSIWDFLEPIVAAADGRLFCDEARVWHLVDNSYTVAGTIAIDGTLTELPPDVIDVDESVDGIPTVITGVVLVYVYVDTATGLTTKSYDVAGDYTGRVYTRTVNQPYPGPGGSSAILTRAQQRSRLMPLHAVSDYDTTPGMALEAAVDGTDYEAIVTAVEWIYDASDQSDTMVVTPRGLVLA